MESVFLSNSLRNKATGCQRAFYFSYFKGLSPKQIPAYFYVGSLWHKLMEELFNFIAAGLEPEKALEKTSESFEVWRREALINTQNDSEAFEKAIKAFDLVAGMFGTYQRSVFDEESKWEVLAIEVPFRLALGNKPRLLAKDDPALKNEFVGIIDLIVRDRTTGIIWPVERKTTSSTSPDFYEVELQYDYQPIGYLIATQLLAKERWPDSPVIGINYRVARKTIPKKPSVNQCKPCKGEGFKIVKVPIAGTKTTGETREICSLCSGTGLGELSLREIDNTDRFTLEATERENPQLQRQEYAQWYSEKYLPFRERILAKAKPFHWSLQHSVPDDMRRAWLIDTTTVAQNIRAMGRKKPERFTRSLDKFGDCPHCQYKEICFDESSELIEALYTTNNLRAALPKELQDRQKEEEKKKQDSDSNLDWL